MKGLGINIRIEEITNGVLVKYFSQKGSSDLDMTVYYDCLDDALKAIPEWLKKLRKSKKEK